jgi:DNA-binding transcriptional regulator PaaX
MDVKLSTWLMLVVSLPGRSQTPRMRLWRALKGGGAAMLRDGVYVLPESDAARALFKAQIDEAKQARGSAHMVSFTSADPKQEADLRDAFDRTHAYAQALERLAALRRELRKLAEA